MTAAAPHQADADRWLKNALIDGVQMLYSLALPGSPAGEVLPLTAQGWIEVLRHRRWVPEQDAARIPKAFLALAGAVDRWPAPRQLLDHLPPVQAVAAITAAPAPVTPERRAQLAAMRRRVADALTSTPQMRAVRVDTFDGGACPTPLDQGIFPGPPTGTGEDQPGRAVTD